MSWKNLTEKKHISKNDSKSINSDKNKDENEEGSPNKRYRNSFMKQFPELYRSDVSINPSYTGLNNLP